MGLPFQYWRENQLRALKELESHEEGEWCLQAPTGTGKTGIALGWGISGAEEGKRTLVLTQRNSELWQYEEAVGFDHRIVSFIRGQRHYHCPLLADRKYTKRNPNLPAEPCQSKKSYCDLSECGWPRFDEQAPCHTMKKRSEECPHYDECPYFRDRARARDAPVLVTNYSYGVLALQLPVILGRFDRMVADEAHDLLAILTDICSLRLNLRSLAEALAEIMQPGSGSGSQSQQVLNAIAAKRATKAGSIDNHYLSTCNELVEEIGGFRAAVESLTESCRQALEKREQSQILISLAEFSKRYLQLLEEIWSACQDQEEGDVDESEIQLVGNLRVRHREMSNFATIGNQQLDNLVPTTGFRPDRPLFAPIDLSVGGQATKMFWDRVDCSLAMSGTLPAPGALRYSLGLTEIPHIIYLSNEFPIERRPVYFWRKTLDLRYESGYKDRQLVLDTVTQLLETPRLMDNKGLVLWPSYSWLIDYLRSASSLVGRIIYHHSSEDATESPSRVQVIA